MIDYKKLLSCPLSLKELDFYRNNILNNLASFQHLFDLIFENDDKFSWKAAWLVEKVIATNKSLLTEEMKIQLMNYSLEIKNASLKRAVLAILVKSPLPENTPVPFINLSIDRVISTSEAVAVQSYSMKMLLKIAEQIPEFIPEFIAIVESLNHDKQSTGFNAMRKNALKSLHSSSMKKS